MTSNDPDTEQDIIQYHGTIGPSHDQWAFTSAIGFDFTRRHGHRTAANTSNDIHVNDDDLPITMSTSTVPITISPALTALVIVDMQNYFLSPFFDRPTSSPGQAALAALVRHAIPAARAAGLRVIWLNWGLDDADLASLPAGVRRAFGFEVSAAAQTGGSTEPVAVDKLGVPRRGEGGAKTALRGLGSDCGVLVRRDGAGKVVDEVQGGRLLVRDQWNSALCPPLDAIYAEGAKLARRPDVWIHKNRMSGMWGARTPLEDFCEEQGIRTLLFAGVNTDQCVAGTLTDAFSKGYDCVLLSDGCGTTSPEYAQQCIEFNAARTYGFLATCAQFADGVAASRTSKS